MSAAKAVSKPPANAQPLTAAITGFEKRCLPRVAPPRPIFTHSAILPGVAST